MNVLMAGCGAMGLPMAEAMMDAGIEINGFDVRLSDAHQQSALHMLDHPQEVQPDVLWITVRDADDVDRLLFDQQALYSGTNAYAPICVISSTLSVNTLRSLRQRLPDSVQLLDAPMSGAPVAAQERNLSFMLGGDEDVVLSLEPCFKAMGTQHFHLGSFGCGMAVKLLNNTVAASSVVAVRRVLAEAHQQGIDPDTLLDVMRCSSGGTWFGNAFHDISWSREQYAPDNTIGILEKDVQCAIDSRQRQVESWESELDKALLSALQQLPAIPKNS